MDVVVLMPLPEENLVVSKTSDVACKKYLKREVSKNLTWFVGNYKILGDTSTTKLLSKCLFVLI